MKIDFTNHPSHPVEKPQYLQIHRALAIASRDFWPHWALGAKINLTITTPQEITQLNQSYRQQNNDTDVLSFPTLDLQGPLLAPASPLFKKAYAHLVEAPARPGVGRAHLSLGDVIICLEKAQDQARQYQHSLDRELAFLAVHGFLHLIGYRHDTPPQEEEMQAAQNKILAEARIPR